MTTAPHLRAPDPVHRRREWGTVADDALWLDRTDAVALVDALNDDVAGLTVLFDQVRKHRWTVEGAESEDLTVALAAAADRLAAATDEVAVRVHALGGVPPSGPRGLRQHAPLFIEAPHRYDVRSSLERDRDGYATLAAQVRGHVALADRVGDAATGTLLRRHLLTLETEAHRFARFLADDSLAAGADR